MRYLSSAVLTVIFGWGAIALLASLVWLLPLLPEPFWPIPLIVAAVPLAMHLVEWRLMKRRVMLSELSHKGGFVHALLWKGRLLQFGSVLVAILMMTGLYLAASTMHWQHWMVLTAYVVILSVVLGPIRNALSSEVNRAHLGMVVRHGPLFWGGVLVIGAAFFAFDFALDQPDLRANTYEFVYKNAYQDGFNGPRATSLGMLLGMANAGRMLSWQWAQTVGSQLDSTTAWLFWLVFLLAIGGVVSLLNAYVLAYVGLAERLAHGASAPDPHPFQVGLTASAVILGVFYIFASYQLSNQSPDELDLPEWADRHLDACRGSEEAVATVTERFATELIEETSRTQDEIAAVVNDGFATLGLGVDHYLNWYFSLVGEYSRLGHTFVGDSAAFMAREFQGIVLDGVSFEPVLVERLRAIETRSNSRLREMAPRYAEALHEALDDNSCLEARLSKLETHSSDGHLRSFPGVAAGGASGITAGVVIGARLGPSIGTRLGAKSMFKAAASLLGKTTLKRGASAAGAAAGAALICSPTGPGAILCGAAAGAVTWIVVDAAVLSADEYLNRDAMRLEIVEALDATKRELLETLAAANATRLQKIIVEIQEVEGELFSPRQEGLGRPRR